MDPPSVYGQSHRAVLADVIDAVHNGRATKTNGHELGRDRLLGRSLSLVNRRADGAKESARL